MALRDDINIDTDSLTEDIQRVDEISDRMRIAGYGLAAPLLRMREAQMQREVARTAAKKGQNHPEVAARMASLQRTMARRAQFDEELSRARLDQPKLSDENGAGVWGRVADAGKPVEGLTVIALANNQRVDFRCTDDNGAFAMEVPAETPLILSVRSPEGAELFRDPTADNLKPGELRFREIDLSRGAGVPCPEPDDRPPGDATFPMLDLVGQIEADARALIRAQGLTLGDRTEQPSDNRAGRILAHEPTAGTPIERGQAVSIVVGSSLDVTVPSVIGLNEQEAAEVLQKSDLRVGDITTIVVVDEKSGLVVNQQPAAGSRVPRGTAVALEVGLEGDEPNEDERRRLEDIANRAEVQLRAEGFGQQEEPNYLARRLQATDITDVARLREFLTRPLSEISARLGFANLEETRRAVALLADAIDTTEQSSGS